MDQNAGAIMADAYVLAQANLPKALSIIYVLTSDINTIPVSRLCWYVLRLLVTKQLLLFIAINVESFLIDFTIVFLRPHYPNNEQ